ncbi:hypothetical protein [Paraburkholderia sp.]|uniref:hypothetical protein n=1 Tax=Paraburkholderia sp. TaxID=1926495 RepID=UPI002D73C52A|nr:hypothetical protein [Paraburkholderia sp.]HZZ05850.1 hypothetical protein [Paraburkholderia sp.]
MPVQYLYGFRDGVRYGWVGGVGIGSGFSDGVFVLRDRAHATAVNRPGWLRALLAGLIKIFRNRFFSHPVRTAGAVFVAQGVALSHGLKSI